MKKTILLFVAIISLNSCSSDDDNGTQNNTENAAQLILGTWNLVSSTEDGVSLNLTECDFQETYSFDSSGNYTTLEYFNDTAPCGNEYISGGSYILDGVDVTFTIGSDIYTQQIQNITETELVLREVYTETDQTNNQGQTFIFVDTYQRQ